MTVSRGVFSSLEEKLLTFADPRFRFDPEPHEYWLGKRELLPATKWLERYKGVFNRLAIAPGVAAGRGCTTAEILAEWDRSGDIGTKTHSFIEHHYDYQRGLVSAPPAMLPDDPEVNLRCRKFLELAGGRLANYEAVAQELRMFYVQPGWDWKPKRPRRWARRKHSKARGFCGTTDLLARHKPSGKLYVIDWKTSKKIERVMNRWGSRLKWEFCDLAKHELNEYSLQISFYRVLLETVGIETAGGAIGWLPTGSMESAPPELITAIDYRDRVRALIL